jgi:hypothetical protein
MGRSIRAFSFSSEVCACIDSVVERVRREPDLAQKLNLSPPSETVVNLNNRGLAPSDYDELRRVSGLKSDGDALIEQMMHDSGLRRLCVSMVSKAQRRNYKARDAQAKVVTINVSRVVAALVVKGAESVQVVLPTEKKATKNATVKLARRESGNVREVA